MFVEANGARLAVEVAGAGAPVLLVHAGICDRRMWRAQVAALAPTFRVVTMDLRGHGESPPVSGRYAHWADVRALLDALEIPRADLVGASMGGGAAIDLALAAPERVGKLVLAAPAISGYVASDEHRARLAAVDEAYRQHGVDAANELELRMWVDGPSRAPDAVPGALRELVRDMNRRALENEIAVPDAEAVPLDPPAIDRLEEVRAETLVIAGALDLRDPLRRFELAARRIPNAKWATIGGAAHLPSLEVPDTFNRLLLEFLAVPG
jgi:pimeloyl-ACP methyl ester carboxylesterase